MTTVKADLTPEDRDEHERRLATATPYEVALARDLQRLVFLGSPQYEGDFAPAPLYLKMACHAREHGMSVLRGFARVVDVPPPSRSAFGRRGTTS